MKVQTTGIGSLPHINVDSAIGYSLRFDIPFLPQLPIYNPKEYMLYQALYFLPGIIPPESGVSLLDLKQWAKHRRDFREKAVHAIASNDFSDFQIISEVWSCLNAFLFEIERNKLKKVKIQNCGLYTCISSLKLSDHSQAKEIPDLIDDIELAVELSSRSLIQRFSNTDVELIIFFDEPGLIIHSESNLQSQKYFKRSIRLYRGIKKSLDVKVGIHCCADSHWEDLFASNSSLDYLSFDSNISIHSIKSVLNNLPQENQNQATLCFGVVGTSVEKDTPYSPALSDTLDFLNQDSHDILVSPACGLAHVSIADTEHVLSCLNKEKSSVSKT